MNSDLNYITISDYTTETGALYNAIELSYEVFGKEIGSGAPVVLVCHALTGNSKVTGEKGWWNGIIGEGRLVDTNHYTIIGFNIPGNGYERDPSKLFDSPEDFSVRDIARLFGLSCKQIGVEKIDYAIGGSLGGGICWELAVLFGDYIGTIVPVASDWKASDWVLAHNQIQDQILKNSTNPLHDARMMAMMFYRTPQSFKKKFGRSRNAEKNMFNIESWLLHHGEKLVGRFYLQAYRLMNNLLSTLDITNGRGSLEEVALQIKANVVMVGIDTDFFFVPDENRETYEVFKKLGRQAKYKEIKSIHGHDGFLIEFEQLSELLADTFNRTRRTECGKTDNAGKSDETDRCKHRQLS
ncbi:alpha/beta fold hydrolase [Puteibacter caeruleilacunae]|nr:alpha/beta fold hydrolase [Puteibacter caeruleilacunae]